MQDMDSTEKMKLMQLTREHESKSTKLDWMYGNPKHVESEEYLLGRAVDASKNHVEHECIPPSIRDLQGPINPVEDQVDLIKKMQEDPLVEIHRRQIEARKKMLQNPIKLKQMQQILNKKREVKSSESGSSSSEDDDLNKKLMEKFLKLKSVKKLKKKLKKKKKKRSKSSDSEKSVSKSKKRRSDSDTREKRDRSKSSSKKKSKHRSESPRVSQKRKDSARESRGKSRSQDRDNRYNSKHKKSDSKKSRKRSSSSSNCSSDEKKPKRDSNSQEREAQYEKYRNPSCDPNKNYGLVNAAGEKLALQKLDQAIIKKVLPKKVDEKKWVKPKHTRLTEDEKEQRRKEMMENAEWKQKNRPKLKSIDQEEKELIKNYKDDPAFLKKYLLKHNESSSVESRIKSNMNNVQRRKGDMDSNFARR